MRSLKVSFLTAAVFLTASQLGRTNSPWQQEGSASPLPPPQHGGGEAIQSCYARYSEIPETLRSGGPESPERVIVVYKRERKLGLYEDGLLSLCVPAELGEWPYEAKVQSDGESTPEGWYTVAVKRTSDPNDAFPKSVFTEALHVSYPNAGDVDRALAKSVISPQVAAMLMGSISRGELPDQDTAMGGAIVIHDWAPGVPTAGCVGLKGEDMHQLFGKTESADPILILPWQTILYEDGTTGQDVIPEHHPDIMPETMIDRSLSRPGHTVMKAIEITAN
jgi:hypothetical protein